MKKDFDIMGKFDFFVERVKAGDRVRRTKLIVIDTIHDDKIVEEQKKLDAQAEVCGSVVEVDGKLMVRWDDERLEPVSGSILLRAQDAVSAIGRLA